MSILVNKNTRVVVQGITGKEGSFHATQCKAYGTKVVAGVTPGKAGQEVEGIPVFNTVADAVKKSVRREHFAKEYGEVFKGDAMWNAIKVPAGDRYAWDDASTYIKKAPYFDTMLAGYVLQSGRAAYMLPCAS